MTSTPPPGPAGTRLTLELAEPTGMRRLLSRRGPHTVTMTPEEIVVEHAATLKAPLRFAPGAVTAATVDAGPADPTRGAGGRFPILHRLTADRVIPREEGIDGWLWTAKDGSACAVLGADAPNVALLFSPPLTGDRVTTAFHPAELAELAKRSPHGEPAAVGLLLRVVDTDAATQALSRFGMLKDVTDRDVPPAQRRHLPGDRQADPDLGADHAAGPDRAKGSVPPPGMGA